MDIDVLWLLAAAGGGAFGAAIGAQTAFVFTGFTVLVGIAGALGGVEGAGAWFGGVAFGPVFGPHIAWAGGAAAAAYAYKRGYFEKGVNGRDVVSALAGISRPDVLFVGAIFGMGGYLLERVWHLLPVFSANGNDLGVTDTVALTVTVSHIVARLLFGVKSRAIFGPFLDGASATRNGKGQHWVEHQESWGMTAVLGLFSGLTFAFATAFIVGTFSDRPDLVANAHLLGFGISGVSLLFLSLGMKTPVTHHMTITAGLATGLLIVHAGTDPIIAVIVGTLVGVFAALLGELASKTMNAPADTHIDPPAVAIFITTTLIYAMVAVIA